MLKTIVGTFFTYVILIPLTVFCFVKASTVPESKSKPQFKNTANFKVIPLNSDKELVEFVYEGQRHVYFLGRITDGGGVGVSKVGDYPVRGANQ